MWHSHRWVGVTLLIGILVALLAAALVGAPQRPTDPDAGLSETLVAPGGGETALWPYTSRSHSPTARTLAINVIVFGEGPAVRAALTGQADADWNRTGPEADAKPSTFTAPGVAELVTWRRARGAPRYTYVTDRTGTGTWHRPAYQLHTGSYLGTRYHLRAYTASNTSWTALQVHREYWDWFRLRHTVTDVAGARDFLARDLANGSGVRSITTERHGYRGGGSDGLLTVITLAVLPTLAAVGPLRRRLDTPLAAPGHALALALSPLVLFLGVRTTGIALEQAVPALTPKLFAGMLYPVLALGIPLAVATLARAVRPRVAVAAPVLGLGVAFAIDFTGLGVGHLPAPLVLHRLAIIAAVGGIAGGRALGTRGRPILVAGLAGWTVGLGLPLLGVL